MCITVELILPSGSNQQALSGALFARTGFSAEHLDATSQGDLVLAVTGALGRCQCMTSLGSAEAPSRKEIEENDLAKLRRRGWSEARIHRWLEEKKRTIKRDVRTFRVHADGPAALPVTDWLGFIEEALSTHVDALGVHVGSGYSKEHEQVTVPVGMLDESMLRGLRRDATYVFVDDGGRDRA